MSEEKTFHTRPNYPRPEKPTPVDSNPLLFVPPEISTLAQRVRTEMMPNPYSDATIQHENIINFLEAIQELPSTKQIELILYALPHKNWNGPHFMQFKSARYDEAKLKILNKTKQQAEQRLNLLMEILRDLPAEVFTDDVINELLIKETKYTSAPMWPQAVRDRVSQYLATQPETVLDQYIDRLKPNEIAHILQAWPLDKTRKIVKTLLDKSTRHLRGHLDWEIDAAVSQIISSWPIEEQYSLFSQDDELSLSYYGLMKNWPVEITKPQVEKMLKRTTANNADRTFMIARVICDWPSADIQSLISDYPNIEASSHFGSNGSSVKDGWLELKAKILIERTQPLTPEMNEWVIEMFTFFDENNNLSMIPRVHRGSIGFWNQLVQIVLKYDSLFAQYKDRIAQSSREADRKQILLKINQLPLKEQYQLIETVATTLSFPFKGDQSTSINMLFEGQYLNIVTDFYPSLLEWNRQQLSRLVNLLLHTNYQWGISLNSSPNLPQLLAIQIITETNAPISDTVLHNLIELSIKSNNRSVTEVLKSVDTERIVLVIATDLKEKLNSPEEEEVKVGIASLIYFLHELNREQSTRLWFEGRKLALDETIDFETRALIFSELVKFAYPGIINQTDDLLRERMLEFAKKMGFLESTDITYENVVRVFQSISVFNMLETIPLQEITFTKEVLEDERFTNFPPLELPVIAHLQSDAGDFSYETLVDYFTEHLTEWQDTSILQQFEYGVEIFGYEKMFSYINHNTHSRHDALHAFPSIIKLLQHSGLTPTEFYGNILHQVAMDQAGYNEGCSQQHLNAISLSFNPDIQRVLDQAREFESVERLTDLVASFDSIETVFKSWSQLKKFSELQQLLDRTEILEELLELKVEGKTELYNYVQEIVFHPNGKINIQAVIEFWRDPDQFLAREASHTPQEVHDRKKPSNYFNIPNLDLTAVELRDALVEQKIDQAQVFTPLKIRYNVLLGNKTLPLHEAISIALGSRKNKIKGRALNPEKLFTRLKQIFKTHGKDLLSYVNSEFELTTSLTNQLIEAIYDPEMGLLNDRPETAVMIVQIYRKSDPKGVLAGDETADCMPYGDGKNTLYTFNLNTAQLTVSLERADGSTRVINQSVLTKDINTDQNIPTLLKSLEKDYASMSDILPESVLAREKRVIAGDSLDTAQNYSSQKYQLAAHDCLIDFLSKYVELYGREQNLDQDKAVVGMAYTNLPSDLPTAPNTYLPQAPVSYSDKTGEKIYQLTLHSNQEHISPRILERVVNEPPTDLHKKEIPLPTIRGLEYLTFEDSLAVGLIESKAYADNKTLIEHLHNMENALIAKAINEAAKDRPNMSLKYVTGNVTRGYLLAWEGKIDDRTVIEQAQELIEIELNDAPCIYIADLATDRESVTAGGRLIQGFIDLYQRNYLQQRQLLPLYMQARERTSYPIIMKMLQRLENQLQLEFELFELPTYQEGSDTMHPLIITPKQR